MQTAFRSRQSGEKKQAGRQATPEKCTCERLFLVCLSTPCCRCFIFLPNSGQRIPALAPSRLVHRENLSSHCYVCSFILKRPPLWGYSTSIATAITRGVTQLVAAQHAERWSVCRQSAWERTWTWIQSGVGCTSVCATARRLCTVVLVRAREEERTCLRIRDDRRPPPPLGHNRWTNAAMIFLLLAKRTENVTSSQQTQKLPKPSPCNAFLTDSRSASFHTKNPT